LLPYLRPCFIDCVVDDTWTGVTDAVMPGDVTDAVVTGDATDAVVTGDVTDAIVV